MTRGRLAAVYAVALLWVAAIAAAWIVVAPYAAGAVVIGGAMPVLAVVSYLTDAPAAAPAGASRREQHRAELDEWAWDFLLAAAWFPLEGDDEHVLRRARDGYRGGPPVSLRSDGTVYVRVPKGPGGGSRRAERVTIHTADGRVVRDYGLPRSVTAPAPTCAVCGGLGVHAHGRAVEGALRRAALELQREVQANYPPAPPPLPPAVTVQREPW